MARAGQEGIAPDVDCANGGVVVPLSELMARTLATNLTGAVATVKHMAPRLERSAEKTAATARTTTTITIPTPPRIIFMGTSGGSLAAAHANSYVAVGYPAYFAVKAR